MMWPLFGPLALCVMLLVGSDGAAVKRRVDMREFPELSISTNTSTNISYIDYWSDFFNISNSDTAEVPVVLHQFFLGDECDLNITMGFRDDHMWVVDHCRTYYRYESLSGDLLPMGKKATLNFTHVVFYTYTDSNGTCEETATATVTEEAFPLFDCTTFQDVDYMEDKEIAFNISQMYFVGTWHINLANASMIRGERKSLLVEPPNNQTCPVVNMTAVTFEGLSLVEPLGECVPLDSLEETTNISTTRTRLEAINTMDLPGYSRTDVFDDKILRTKFWDGNCTEMAYGNVEFVMVGRCSKNAPYLSSDLLLELIVTEETNFTMVEPVQPQNTDEGIDPGLVAADPYGVWNSTVADT